MTLKAANNHDLYTSVLTFDITGSPVLGVLSNYYSAPRLEAFNEAKQRFLQEGVDSLDNNTTDLSRYRTFISAGLFVDDGKFHTSSISPHLNAKRLKNAFKVVLQWAKENGVSIDLDKMDYIVFTRPWNPFPHCH